MNSRFLQIVAILALAVPASACNRHTSAAGPAAMIGATETQLLARYGQPDRRFSYDDRTRLTWLSSDVWRVPGPRGPRSSVVSFPCETSFEIIHGRVFSYDQTGGGC